jgi:hypothetical protein
LISASLCGQRFTIPSPKGEAISANRRVVFGFLIKLGTPMVLTLDNIFYR